MKNNLLKILSILPLLVLNSGVTADFEKIKVDADSLLDSNELTKLNQSKVSFGLSGHETKGGRALGYYVSGITFIEGSDIGGFGRFEYINDEYKTGKFQSINIAIGIAYRLNENISPYLSIGKCFSSYLTCYFNSRNAPGAPASADYNAVYYGAGTTLSLKLLNNSLKGHVDLAIDYSPYKEFNAHSFYIGYGVSF